MSLLMEALKRAEREKQKISTDEPVKEQSGNGLVVEPPPTPEPLRGEGSFPSLEWAEPVMAFPAEPALSLEARTLEPVPAAATEPAFSPLADATRQQNVKPPLQASPVWKEPEPVKSPPPQTAFQNGIPSTIKPPLAQESTTAQRQQHAAKVLAATQKTSGRNWLLPTAISTAAIFLLAGGAYLYWQYPQLFSAPGQGAPHPAAASSPPVPATMTMATVAPSQLSAAPSSPPPMLTAPETTTNDASPPGKRQVPPTSAAPRVEQTPKESAITFRRVTHKEQVAPALDRGYSAFMAGNDSLAQQEYVNILRQDGNNRDALLGMAAISAKRGNSDEAVKIYLRLQELDPRDAEAQAGILALTAGQTDPVQSESRVKTLLAQQPDAHFLHFALGNLYAGQSRWAEAQQAFFHAYQKAPGNPDYLYNLAISLDHLNQGKLALEHYQRALALSQSGPANFDKAAAQTRAKELHKIFHGLQPVESQGPLGLQPAGN